MKKWKKNFRDATDFSVYKQLVKNTNLMLIGGTTRKPTEVSEYYVYKISKYSPFTYKDLLFVTAINTHDINFRDFIKRQLKDGCYVLANWEQSMLGHYLLFDIDIQHNKTEGDCACTEEEK